MATEHPVQDSESTPQDLRQHILDEEHLRLLALFHYISGGITIAFASLYIFPLGFIMFAMNNPEIFAIPGGPEGLNDTPDQLLDFFAAFVGSFIAGGIAYGIVQIVSGRFMSRRRHRTFSFIAIFPNILFIPYGTLLAIFTLIVLERPSVKALYELQNNERPRESR
jgi:hypothetical protein